VPATLMMCLNSLSKAAPHPAVRAENERII